MTLDTQQQTTPAPEQAEPAAADDDSGEEEPVAGPISIAVDVSEEAPGADNPTP